MLCTEIAHSKTPLLNKHYITNEHKNHTQTNHFMAILQVNLAFVLTVHS